MKIFIGYDTREDIAYEVCKHSIITRQPQAKIYPVVQDQLIDLGLYSRGIDKLASTQFTYTRFLVPKLCDYKGWALFIDCDTILKEDIKYLFDYVNDKYAIMCVKHDYKPKSNIKMDGQIQTTYPRKNWSSVMLINCEHDSNKILTPNLISDENITGAYLHRFSWLHDNEIGELPVEWNWLVSHYKQPEDGIPKLIHYTEGGPWFHDYTDCEYSEDWKQELSNLQEGK